MKGFYIFTGTAAVCLLGYWIYSKSKTQSNANDTVSPGAQLDYNKVLKSGVRGIEVSEATTFRRSCSRRDIRTKNRSAIKSGKRSNTNHFSTIIA